MMRAAESDSAKIAVLILVEKYTVEKILNEESIL